MKNLLKCTLGVLIATVAVGALASAAVAGPALSPVPSECSGCASQPFGFTLGGGRVYMTYSGTGSNWSYASSSGEVRVGDNGEFVSGAKLTFSNTTNGCKNEGNNFTASNLKGRFGFVTAGTVGMILEPEGTVFAKCVLFGVPEEVTGSLIGTITPLNTRTTEFTVNYIQSAGNQVFREFEGEEPIRELSLAPSGGNPSPLGIEAEARMTTFEPVELNTTGGVSRFFTSTGGNKPTGGFVLTGKSMKFISKNGLEVQCKATWGSGEFTSATGGHLLLKFTKCTGPLGVKCQSAHGAEKEIFASRLKALLAYTDPAEEVTGGRQTAVLLSPESGEVFTEFTCGTVKSVVTGSVLAVISPLGAPSNTFGLTLKQSKGREETRTFEGTGGESLEAMLQTSTAEGKREESGIEMSPTVQFAGEAMETIK